VLEGAGGCIQAYVSTANAFPTELIRHFDIVGINRSLMSLRLFATASKFRVAMMSKVFDGCVTSLENCGADEDALYVLPQEWWQRSCLKAIADAKQRVLEIDPLLGTCTKKIQRICLKTLMMHDTSAKDVAGQMVYRNRGRCVISNEQVERLLRFLKLRYEVPRYLLLPFLRSLCNGWCTDRRLGLVGPCPFCREDRGSDEAHCAKCPEITGAIARALPQPMASHWPASTDHAKWLGADCPEGGIIPLVICHDLVYACHNDRRHGGSQETVLSIMRSRIRQIALRAPAMQCFFHG